MAKDIDYSAEWLGAKTQGEKDGWEKLRREKEQSMKSAGTWDKNWKSSDELFGRRETPQDIWNDAQNEADYRLGSMKQGQIQSVERQAEAAQRSAYIQKRQSQKNAPAYMAMTGQTGGLSETTAVAPNAAYGNALSSIDSQKADLTNKINMANDEQALSLAIEIANKKANQYNSDKVFNRNVYENDRAYANGISQQAIEKAYRDAQVNYGKSRDKFEEELIMAEEAAKFGDYSIYRKLGIDTSLAEALARAEPEGNAGKQKAGAMAAKPKEEKTDMAKIDRTIAKIVAEAKTEKNSYLDLAAKGRPTVQMMIDSGELTPEQAVLIMELLGQM